MEVSSQLHGPKVLTSEIKPAVASEEEDGGAPDPVWTFSRKEENGTPNSWCCNGCLTKCDTNINTLQCHKREMKVVTKFS
jgi:hypothetical protein